MISEPHTHPADTSLAGVRGAFRDDHVYMILLTEAGTLAGTLTRDDLPDEHTDGPALTYARLHQRTVTCDEPVNEIYTRLIAGGQRRLAVINDDGRLLGLICLKRNRTGFCNDADVHARRQDLEKTGHPQPTGSANNDGARRHLSPGSALAADLPAALSSLRRLLSR